MTHMQYLINASLVNSSLAAHLIHWIRAFAVLGDVALVCLCCSAIVSGSERTVLERTQERLKTTEPMIRAVKMRKMAYVFISGILAMH